MRFANQSSEQQSGKIARAALYRCAVVAAFVALVVIVFTRTRPRASSAAKDRTLDLHSTSIAAPPRTVEPSSTGEPTQPISKIARQLSAQLPAGRVDLGLAATWLKNNPKYKLTESQIEAVQKTYDRLAYRCAALENQVAIRESISSDEVLITIPGYKDLGQEAFAEFVDEVKAQIGSDLGDQFINDYRVEIRSENDDFGEQPQEILVTKKGSSYHFVHKTLLPEPTIGVDQVTKVVTSDLSATNLDRYRHLKSFLP